MPLHVPSLVRRLVDRRSPAERVYRRILEEVDWEAFERMKARYAGGPDSRSPKAKYFEIERFLLPEIRRALRLGLHELAPRRILDVGCGFGYFAIACQHLGHSVTGIDLPRSAHDADSRPSTADLYDDAAELFGISRTLFEIRPFEPLPEIPGAPFHVVSANHVTFNGHGTEKLWGPREWGFFLDDLSRQLAPGARILIGLNGEGGCDRFYTPELRAFFEARGASVEGNAIDLRAA